MRRLKINSMFRVSYLIIAMTRKCCIVFGRERRSRHERSEMIPRLLIDHRVDEIRIDRFRRYALSLSQCLFFNEKRSLFPHSTLTKAKLTKKRCWYVRHFWDDRRTQQVELLSRRRAIPIVLEFFAFSATSSSSDSC